MSVPLEAMDYTIADARARVRFAHETNPYMLVLAPGDSARELLARLPSRHLASMPIGAEGHNTVEALDSNGKTRRAHKSMTIPQTVVEKYGTVEKALDAYKVALYGPNLEITQKETVGKGSKRSVVVEYNPALQDIHCDEHGALSFSSASGNNKMCIKLVQYAERAKMNLDDLTITDATAGCGGDSMQFITATRGDKDKVPLFARVTSVEIHANRCVMLKHNLKVVAEAFQTRVESTVLFTNYANTLGLRKPIRKSEELDVLQDIVYIDPPWGGKSHEQSRSALTLYSNTTDEKLITAYEGEKLVIDYHLTVDKLIKSIIKGNIYNGDNNRKQTTVVAVKTPMYWQNEMVDAIRQFDGYLGAQTVRCGKYDVILFFLKTMTTPVFIKEVFAKGKLTGFLSWQEQQEELLFMFPDLKKKGYCSEGKPVFLQNIWENMDESMGKDLDGYWDNTYVHPYSAGALHHHTNMHCGEKKLLHSSLYTILYGLQRIKRSEFFRGMRWEEVLRKTIVLYVGAAGLNKESHHFNELLRAIPGVHFACYDIRKIETTLDPEHTKRMTNFHKIFTNNDLERWIAFAQKYTDKPIIFISDIRTDWTAAMQEMDASKTVALQKIWLLKRLKELPTLLEDTKDKKNEAAARATRMTLVRGEIDMLFRHNRAISVWIDRQVETDNFVQWRWFRRLQESTETCAIMSSKTREPYQRAANPEQTYSYFPGPVLLQTGTSASTEGRTQCCPNNFNPKKTGTYAEMDFITMALTGKRISYETWFTKKCIDKHFKSRGDPTSFATESIDYTREWHSSFDDTDNGNSDLHRQSVMLLDSKMAYYNSDVTQTQQRRFTYEAVKLMYKQFSFALAREKRSDLEFNVLQWFDDIDKKLADRAQSTHMMADGVGEEHKEHAPELRHKSGWKGFRPSNHTNLDELIRDDNEGLVTAHIDLATIPAWATVGALTTHFGAQATMRRYEWHLLATKTIWDTSRAAMEALLVLNMNLLRGDGSTATAINNYRHIEAHSRMPPYLKRRLNLQHQTELRALRMPAQWILAQLRFNIQNPYRGTMYDETSLKLEGRYETVTAFLNDQVQKAVWSQTQAPLTYKPAPLMYKPGSASAGDAQAWIKRHVDLYKTHDTSPGGTDMARDWYCYWLQTLLENRDGADLKDTVTVDEIVEAIHPYFERKQVGVGNTPQYRLLRSPDVSTDAKKAPRPSLDPTLWPRGKPVLYYACEKGCLAMVQFCLLGYSKGEIKHKINTPRMKHMRLTREIMSAREREKPNYTPTNPDQETTQQLNTEVENYPLHVAVWNGHPLIVAYLIERGADKGLRNFWNETAALCGKASIHEFAVDAPRTVRINKCLALLED